MFKVAVAGAVIVAASVTGCGSTSEPSSVVFGIDGSGSSQGMSKVYFAGVSAWLNDHDQDFHATALGLTGTSGDRKLCPTVSADIVGEGGSGDARAEDRRMDRAAFLSQVAQLAACLDRNRGVSDLVAFEGISTALGSGGTAVLFTDALIHHDGVDVDRPSLTEPSHDRDFLNQFTSTARIDAVTVEVHGAGAGSGLTDTELAGLHRRWGAVVPAKGGTLTVFTPAVA